MAFDAAAPVAPPMQAANASAKSPARQDAASDPFGALLAMLDGAQTEPPQTGSPRPANEKPDETADPIDGASDSLKETPAEETKPAADAAVSDPATLVAAMMAPAVAPPAASADDAAAAAPASPSAATTALAEATAQKPDLAAADGQGAPVEAAPAPPPPAAAEFAEAMPKPAQPQTAATAAPEQAPVTTDPKPAEPARVETAPAADAEPKAAQHAVASHGQDHLGDGGGDGRPSGADASQQPRNDLAAPPASETATFAAVAPEAPAPAVGATQAAAPAPVIAAQAAATPVRGAPETVAHLAAQMIQRLDGRTTRFDLTLNPQSLGRVDVRIEIGAKGALRARMAFDDAATAQELSGRHTELRAALQSAGFDVPEGALSFDVASGGGGAFAERQDAGRAAAPLFQNLADAADQDPVAAVRNYFNAAGSSGVDIRV